MLIMTKTDKVQIYFEQIYSEMTVSLLKTFKIKPGKINFSRISSAGFGLDHLSFSIELGNIAQKLVPSMTSPNFRHKVAARIRMDERKFQGLVGQVDDLVVVHAGDAGSVWRHVTQHDVEFPVARDFENLVLGRVKGEVVLDEVGAFDGVHEEKVAANDEAGHRLVAVAAPGIDGF